MGEEKEYDLDKSIKGLGILVPIIKNKRTGHLIDGRHRKDYPNAPVHEIDIPEDLEPIARLAINNVRRNADKDEDEWKDVLGKVVGLQGKKPHEIADLTGIHLSTIYRHLPQNLKDQKLAEAQKEGWKEKSFATAKPLEQQIQNMTQLPECERCHIHSSTVKPLQVNGKPRNLCDKCNQHAKLHPEEVVSHFRFLEQVKAGKVPPKLAIPPKPTETWEYRKAQMTPQHSKMEEQVINLLSEKGVRGIVQDRNFCLLTTTPDIFFASENKAVYLDGKEVHANQTDRDEKLRETLQKRGVKVLSITYDSGSQRETERVTNQILEWLGIKKEA